MPVWPNATRIAEPAGHVVVCSTGPGNKSELVLGKLAGQDGISDDTLLVELSGITDPAFLLVGKSTADLARKLVPTGWGLSNLLATVPAGRVPYSHTDGTVTSSSGLTYSAGVFSAPTTTVTSGSGANSGLTIQPPSATDVAGIFRVLHSNGNPVLSCNTSSYITQFGPGGPSVDGVNGNLTLKSAGDLRADSFAAFTITNPTLRWPSSTPDLSFVRDSAGVLRVGNGSTGVGGLITGPLTVRNVAGSYDAFTAAIDGAVKTRGEYQNWNGSTVYNRLAYTGLFINANTSAIRFVPGDPSTLSPDAEVARSSAGFVGLGTPTNKVVVGHDGASGWVETTSGKLVLAPFTGQLWFTGTGSAGMRSSAVLGLSDNVTLSWTIATNNFYSATVDTRIRRSAAGVLDIDSGTDGQYRDLMLRNLTSEGNITLTIPTVTGGTPTRRLTVTDGTTEIFGAPYFGNDAYVYIRNLVIGLNESHTLSLNSTVQGGGILLSPSGTYTGTVAQFQTQAVGQKALILKGYSGQTANLTEWQNSTPTTVASVSAAGLGTFAGVTVSSGNVTMPVDGVVLGSSSAGSTGMYGGSLFSNGGYLVVRGSGYATAAQRGQVQIYADAGGGATTGTIIGQHTSGSGFVELLRVWTSGRVGVGQFATADDGVNTLQVVGSVSASGLGTFAGLTSTGTLTVQQSGGTPGTDEGQLTHTGSRLRVDSLDGPVTVRGTGTTMFEVRRKSDDALCAFFDNAAQLNVGAIDYLAAVKISGGVLAIQHAGVGDNGTISSVPRAVSISADQNDYAPGTAMYIDVTTDGTDRHVTGLVAGVNGQTVYIRHVAGAGNLILDHESASSVAANRFDIEGAANSTVPLRGSVMLTYSTVISRWRAFPSKSCT